MISRTGICSELLSPPKVHLFQLLLEIVSITSLTASVVPRDGGPSIPEYQAEHDLKSGLLLAAIQGECRPSLSASTTLHWLHNTSLSTKFQLFTTCVWVYVVFFLSFECNTEYKFRSSMQV
jgi:hypothetical protein